MLSAAPEAALSATLVDPDGSKWVGMLGLGTLMSEVSAKSTSPSARSFSLCTVRDYRRVFAHPSHHVLRRGHPFAHFATAELAGLSCEPCPGASFSSVYFEVPADEFPALAEREDMYEMLEAEAELADSAAATIPAAATASDGHAADAAASGGQQQGGSTLRRCGYVCCRTTDERMRARMGEWAFQSKYGRHYAESAGAAGSPEAGPGRSDQEKELIPGPPLVWGWSGPILPARIYLRHCVLAIGNQAGQAAVDAFLDDTFLWDRTTMVRQHLEANPAIMATPPPADHPDAYKFNG